MLHSLWNPKYATGPRIYIGPQNSTYYISYSLVVWEATKLLLPAEVGYYVANEIMRIPEHMKFKVVLLWCDIPANLISVVPYRKSGHIAIFLPLLANSYYVAYVVTDAVIFRYLG